MTQLYETTEALTFATIRQITVFHQPLKMSDTRYDVTVTTKQNSLSLKNRNITALAGGMSGGRGKC